MKSGASLKKWPTSSAPTWADEGDAAGAPLSPSQQPRFSITSILIVALLAAAAMLPPAHAGYTAEEARKVSGELKNDGVRAYHAGLLSLAIDKLSAAIDINLNDFFAHYYLGLALRDQRRYPEARVILEITTQLDPRYLPAQVALGHVALGQGDPDEARTWFQGALNAQATYSPALDGMGRLEEATGNDQAAILRYRQAIEANRGFPDPYINLGNLFRRQGRVDDAISLFQEAIHFQPGFAEGYMFLGDAYGRLGRRTEATALLEKASELEPENPDPHIALGDLFTVWDDRVQARAAYEEARRLGVERYEPPAGLAELARRDGDYRQADEWMNQALAMPGISSDMRTTLLARQTTYRIERQRAEVATARLDAARLTGTVSTETGYALVHLARLRHDALDLTGAFQACQEALPILERPVDLVSECGYYALQARDWGPAAALLGEAAERDPTDAWHLVNLGLAHNGLGRLTSSTAAFEQALALDSRSERATIYLGNARYRLGQMDQAEALYRRALTLTPDPEELERLQKVLVHLEDLRLQREAAASQAVLDAAAGVEDDATDNAAGSVSKAPPDPPGKKKGRR